MQFTETEKQMTLIPKKKINLARDLGTQRRFHR